MKDSKNIRLVTGESITKKEFRALIKEAEKGPFKEMTDFDTFKKDIMTVWKKKYGKK